MAWFRDLFCFDEGPSFTANQERFRLDHDGYLVSTACPALRHYVGNFTVSSVDELRRDVAPAVDWAPG